ncbi:PIG-L family deacetylase [Priestia megaterium]|uniref:PIG-L family deacetylase n=1 Tax=Priestia megaterium TaxID=1404 RepID=UPI0021ACB4AB|nr:PIG-L family deacetylase [Priestia megaterium]MCR8927479.1 PIG-L family deacetylase [Priestia megaterium]
MNNLNSVNFFIVAHMDDWQLFMNPIVSLNLSEEKNKIVIIYTTGNDAGGGENYWRAKEVASISSIFSRVTHLRKPNFSRSLVKIYDHYINRASISNAVSYFLRLPDGNLNGEGFSSQGHQSMKKFYNDNKLIFTTIDQSTTYFGWKDLVYTLQGIIDYESKGFSSIILNHPETNDIINPQDHSDHIFTGLAVQGIPRYKKYHKFAYVGYNLINYPLDLAGEELFWKIGQFIAYDTTLYNLTGYSTIKEAPSSYIGFCFKSANSRKIDD